VAAFGAGSGRAHDLRLSQRGGVWLGSFLVNLSVLSPDAALPVAAAIATGSALQAVFGAWLIARAIPNFSPRHAERENLSILPVAPLDIARFAGLAALSGVIAASVGVASLCAATFAPWSKAAGLWLAWWIGDYAGILVFTPALIVVTALIRRWPFAEPIIFPFAAGCLGLALIAAAIIGQMRLDRNEEALVDATEDMVGQIRGAIDNSLVNLVALEGLFAASDEVSREEFKKFTLRLLRVDPTTFALSWRPRIRAAEEAKYVEAAHKDGLADFAILEQDPSGKRSPAAARPEYFPIYFSESLGAQSDLFGLDVSADPVRLASFNRARDSGEMVATPPTRRVGQQTQQKNIVLQKAVYRYGVIPDSIQGRRDNLVGYVQSVLRMDALVKTLLGGPAYQEREMFLFDVSSVEHPELIVVHPTPPETPGSPPPLADLAELRRGVHYEAPLSVGGRPWLALVRPLTSPAHVLWNWRIWMVLLMGLALSAALLVYLRARQRSDASLREAEEHYRGLFDSAPAMYVTARVEDGLPIVTDCNALFLRALAMRAKK
jgi:CHASE1-domain containing sensor protein